MGQPLPNTVDEATIRATLAAFETTMANTNAAIQSVEAVSSSVPWTGNAANQYRAALQGWLNGILRVRQGLEMLRQAMSTHLSVSSTAENEAASMARWYTG
jgi:hypothetical protein